MALGVDLRNLYVSVAEFNARGNITTTDAARDATIARAISASSRDVDRYCGRYFFTHIGTKYFNGDGTVDLLIPDLAAITTVKDDDDDDRTFENTWTLNTDYLTWPWGVDPTDADDPFSRPWTRLICDFQNSTSYSYWPTGIRTVEIAGEWGYWKHHVGTPSVDLLTAAVTTTTATTIPVDAGTSFGIGETIVVDSEQMFISSISSNNLTVVRGVNGTTAATHANDAAVLIVRYPEPVVEATYLLANKLWARRMNPFGAVVGIPESGTITVAARGMPEDVTQLLDQYRLQEVLV